MRIPKLIHQIWLGPSEPPDSEAAYRASWAEHHPNWEVRLWTDADLPEGLSRPEVYERLRLPAERADILRLELLRRFGGVYADTDFECLKPLDDLIEDADFFIGDLKPGRVNNAIIGSVPEHPLVGRLLAELQPAEWHGTDPKAGTGPHFVDRVVRTLRDEITVFPPSVFYPSTPAERESAHAIHHAAKSWVDAEGLRYRLDKTQRRLEAAKRELASSRRGGVRTVLRRLRGR